MLTLVEKVIVLQSVDVFRELPTAQLAAVAAIAQEVSLEASAPIYAEGDVSDAMYVVLEGKVALVRGGSVVATSDKDEAFGTWALFDDELRLTGARTEEFTRLLCIEKDDFIDVLADNVEVTRGLLKAFVRRFRRLAGRIAPNGG